MATIARGLPGWVCRSSTAAVALVTGRGVTGVSGVRAALAGLPRLYRQDGRVGTGDAPVAVVLFVSRGSRADRIRCVLLVHRRGAHRCGIAVCPKIGICTQLAASVLTSNDELAARPLHWGALGRRGRRT